MAQTRDVPRHAGALNITERHPGVAGESAHVESPISSADVPHPVVEIRGGHGGRLVSDARSHRRGSRWAVLGPSTKENPDGCRGSGGPEHDPFVADPDPLVRQQAEQGPDRQADGRPDPLSTDVHSGRRRQRNGDGRRRRLIHHGLGWRPNGFRTRARAATSGDSHHSLIHHLHPVADRAAAALATRSSVAGMRRRRVAVSVRGADGDGRPYARARAGSAPPSGSTYRCSSRGGQPTARPCT